MVDSAHLRGQLDFDPNSNRKFLFHWPLILLESMLRRSRYRYKQIGKSVKNMGFSLPKVKLVLTLLLHTHIFCKNLLYELKNC